jgi:hypothetical protein
MAGGKEGQSLEYTPTWVVAVVCSVIVLISLSLSSESSITLARHAHVGLSNRCPEAFSPTLKK